MEKFLVKVPTDDRGLVTKNPKFSRKDTMLKDLFIYI